MSNMRELAKFYCENFPLSPDRDPEIAQRQSMHSAYCTGFLTAKKIILDEVLGADKKLDTQWIMNNICERVKQALE